MAVLLDSYVEANSDGTFDTLSDANQLGSGQTCSPSSSGTLNYCQFYLKKVGSPTGNAVAKIYAHTGTYGTNGTPTGAALATSDNLNVAGLTTSFVLTQLTFTGANKISLTSGTRYALAIEYSNGNGSNNVSVATDNSAPTHGGNEFYWDAGIPGYNSDNTYDTIFYLYADDPAVTAKGSTLLTLNVG